MSVTTQPPPRVRSGRRDRPRLAGGPQGVRRRAYKGERSLRWVVVLGILAFNLALLVIPIGWAFLGSFHEWNPLDGTFRYVGIANYAELLSSATFWKSAVNTTVFGVTVIAFRVVLGLALAYALYSKLTRFKTFFRTVFYMPVVTPLVAVAYVWKLMYHPQIGAFNTFLGLDINWLYDSRFALATIILLTVWKDFGYAMILFLAGLHSLPEDALEAASVDGAGSWKRFWYVVLPLLRPMVLFVVVTSIITYLQTFVQVLVLTKGGPGTSTYILSYLLYDKAFLNYDFGYASALAFILLLVTGVLTFLFFRLVGGRSLFGRGTR